jgi:hypothetical protein
MKHGLRFQVVEMTPQKAAKYLAKNASNRNMRLRKVAEYKRQMDKGYWRLTSEGISVGSDGTLLDGQHRLQAVIEHGKAVPMVVITGLPPGTQQYMDSGIPRRVGDNLKMFDGEKSGHWLAAVCRALVLFETGDWGSPLTLDEARAVIKKFRASVDWAQTVSSRRTSGMQTSAYFYAPLVWLHHHGWGDEIEQFAHEMETLEGLQRGSAVLALHRAFSRVSDKARSDSGNRSVAVSMKTFAALRAYMENEELSSRAVRANPAGFDYFSAQVHTLPKRRFGAACRWAKGCSFKAPGATEKSRSDDQKLCYIHKNFRSRK